MFTRLQMNYHVLKSGKTIGNIDHHTVPGGLVKARRFLHDEYLKDIEYTSAVIVVEKNPPPPTLSHIRVWQEKDDSVTMCWH